jgi:hypothetical protein
MPASFTFESEFESLARSYAEIERTLALPPELVARVAPQVSGWSAGNFRSKPKACSKNWSESATWGT